MIQLFPVHPSHISIIYTQYYEYVTDLRVKTLQLLETPNKLPRCSTDEKFRTWPVHNHNFKHALLRLDVLLCVEIQTWSVPVQFIDDTLYFYLNRRRT
jgi:hypothetical protein